MEKNNKKRLLYLLDILKKESDGDTRLSMSDIISLLEEKGLSVSDRKTIYDDIKTLNDWGLDIEYDEGYYLMEAPFTLSEIKIIQDSINSLKNLDEKLLNDLNEKLYSFISFNEERLLNKLSYTNKHKDKKLLQRMEDILQAIKNDTAVIIKRKDKEKETVFPVFLHRSNDYYYFYYHYENDKRLYHYRFDNINDLVLTDIKDVITVSRKTILDTIEASSNSYHKGKNELVLIRILNDSDYLRQRFLDDFPNAVATRNGFSIIVSVNDIFFSRIISYGTDIKIDDPKTAHRFREYLNKVNSLYLPEK